MSTYDIRTPKPALKRTILVKLLIMVTLSGCVATRQILPTQQPAAISATSTQETQPTLTAIATQRVTQDVTQSVPSVWISPDIPDGLRATFKLPNDLIQVTSQKEADFQINLGEAHPISTWIYALVAPFPTVTDGIGLDELMKLWREGSIQSEAVKEILVDSSTQAAFEALWGQPSSAVRTLPASQLVGQAWDRRTSWAILPFEQLESPIGGRAVSHPKSL